MSHRLEVRQMFDESFKRKVIEEYFETGCTKMELLKKYNIHFKSAIQTWMRKLGYTEGNSKQKPKFGKIISPALPTTNTTNENNEELKKRIRDLERLLLDEKLRCEAYQRIIDKAEKELKISIRKKPSTK